MNQDQRDRIQQALDILEEVVEEEEGKLDNMGDNFSETERYQLMEEKKDELDNIRDELEIFMGDL